MVVIVFTVGCFVGLVVVIVVIVGCFVGFLVPLKTDVVLLAFTAEVEASRTIKVVGTVVGLVLLLGVAEGVWLGGSFGETLTGAGLCGLPLRLLLVLK